LVKAPRTLAFVRAISSRRTPEKYLAGRVERGDQNCGICNTLLLRSRKMREPAPGRNSMEGSGDENV